MKSLNTIVFAILFTSFCYAQEEKCSTTEDSIVDPNSITKCSIEDVKKTLQDINGEDATIKYHKKRKRVSSNGLASTNNISSEVKNNTELVSKIELKKDVLASVHKIPFHLVEQIPLFKDCEDSPLIQQSKCFEKQMAKHIVSNFNYPKEAIINKIEARILVQFTINEKGNVIDIKKKGPEGTELLKEEAVRLISKLPKFISGKHNGKNVKVKYGLPLTFKLPKS